MLKALHVVDFTASPLEVPGPQGVHVPGQGIGWTITHPYDGHGTLVFKGNSPLLSLSYGQEYPDLVDGLERPR